MSNAAEKLEEEQETRKHTENSCIDHYIHQRNSKIIFPHQTKSDFLIMDLIYSEKEN